MKFNLSNNNIEQNISKTKNYNKIIAISDENVIKFHGEKLKNFEKYKP